jgi:pyruvate formate lyase activating enzyme
MTENKIYRRLNIHNYGCDMSCSWCFYKLNGRREPNKYLSTEEIIKHMEIVDVDRVSFVGGEPTSNPQLEEVAEYASVQLGLITKLGHSNGAQVPPPFIDEANISIKTLRDDLSLDHCGRSGRLALENFRKAYDNGVKLEASTVLIPGLIDRDQVLEVAEAVSKIDDRIPFHIIGYIPVPGAEWRRPTHEEMKDTFAAVSELFDKVTMSHWAPSDWKKGISKLDPRFEKVNVVRADVCFD